MRTVTLSAAIEPLERTIPRVQLGGDGDETGACERRIGVHDDDRLICCASLYRNDGEAHAFSDATIWAGFLVIGWAERLYLVALEHLVIVEHRLGAYFGYLYPTPGALFVASAERVYRFSPDGTLAWRSEPVGLDGVIVHDVDVDTLEGSGEWDPPGGWRPFRLCAATGELR